MGRKKRRQLVQPFLSSCIIIKTEVYKFIETIKGLEFNPAVICVTHSVKLLMQKLKSGSSASNLEPVQMYHNEFSTAALNLLLKAKGFPRFSLIIFKTIIVYEQSRGIQLDFLNPYLKYCTIS